MSKIICPRFCIYNATGYCMNEEMIKLIGGLNKTEEYISGCLCYRFNDDRWMKGE